MENIIRTGAILNYNFIYTLIFRFSKGEFKFPENKKSKRSIHSHTQFRKIAYTL